MFDALYHDTKITLKRGDITTEEVQAIVNAANRSLLGGGGVDGAIHRAGGPSILEECKEIRGKIGECSSGDAVITGAGYLKAEFVIHAVGPVWKGGDHNERELLKSAYKRALRLATEKGVKSIAFPSISTGAYGFPTGIASRIALETVREFLEGEHLLEEVRFILFSEEDLHMYQHAMGEVFGLL